MADIGSLVASIGLAHMVGARCVIAPVDDRMLYDVTRLRKLVTPRTRAIVPWWSEPWTLIARVKPRCHLAKSCANRVTSARCFPQCAESFFLPPS